MEDEKAREALKYLLDTNVLSEVGKPVLSDVDNPRRPHGGVLAWFTAHHEDGFGIPVIALFEMQMGVEKLRPKDPVRAAQFEFWITRLEGGSAVIPFDSAASRETARLLRGLKSDKLPDAMIAAMARVHGLIVATRNTRDFADFDVELENPFLFGKP